MLLIEMIAVTSCSKHVLLRKIAVVLGCFVLVLQIKGPLLVQVANIGLQENSLQ